MDRFYRGDLKLSQVPGSEAWPKHGILREQTQSLYLRSWVPRSFHWNQTLWMNTGTSCSKRSLTLDNKRLTEPCSDNGRAVKGNSGTQDNGLYRMETFRPRLASYVLRSVVEESSGLNATSRNRRDTYLNFDLGTSQSSLFATIRQIRSGRVPKIQFQPKTQKSARCEIEKDIGTLTEMPPTNIRFRSG